MEAQVAQVALVVTEELAVLGALAGVEIVLAMARTVVVAVMAVKVAAVAAVVVEIRLASWFTEAKC